MRVFLSWSGERSRAAASALSELLPDVMPALSPWMSEHDIAAGARWGHELAVRLEDAGFGVICLTPENIGVPWLLYEAGALSTLR